MVLGNVANEACGALYGDSPSPSMSVTMEMVLEMRQSTHRYARAQADDGGR
ncbi:hypothetical protein HRbin30_01111 [bacterium HR30]|nr:hypothetical protein HRbin30_01111 [bacterium HR30]